QGRSGSLSRPDPEQLPGHSHTGTTASRPIPVTTRGWACSAPVDTQEESRVTAGDRAARTEVADLTCRAAYAAAGGPGAGVALVAVGGYGRGELAPRSDLDVVLVHDDDVDPGALASELWYPLWD